MMRFIFIFICLSYYNLCNAQGFGYDSKTEIGNGLYKVKSGKHYGIIDKDDNVIVSIEYQDILFKNGKALLTKENVLYGIVDSLGAIKSFSPQYKVHPKYRYIYDGYIIVGDSKWGFITENAQPLRLKNSFISFFTLSKKSPSMFDDIAPFVEGRAAVYHKKSGWKHIDKNGFERYVLGNPKDKAIFRSSVYNGECIIVTTDGIKQYQEKNVRNAVVKRVLSSSATTPNFVKGIHSSKLIFKEGILTIDSLMRVTKFESDKDSIVFIASPRKVVVKKNVQLTDKFSLKDYLKIDLVYKNIQANEKGKAHTEVRITNTSNNNINNLNVSLKCANTNRTWTGPLAGNSDINISFNIPARFASPSIRRIIKVEINKDKEHIELEYPVTIKRYTPVRSR